MPSKGEATSATAAESGGAHQAQPQLLSALFDQRPELVGGAGVLCLESCPRAP